MFVIQRSNANWVKIAAECHNHISEMIRQGDVTVKVEDVARSLDQNSKMWPMLADFAKHVPWPVNGTMQLIDSDDWKAILTAAFEQEGRMAPGLRGGFVFLGARTSKYTKKRMADFITFLYAEGNERGVPWSEPSKRLAEEYA